MILWYFHILKTVSSDTLIIGKTTISDINFIFCRQWVVIYWYFSKQWAVIFWYIHIFQNSEMWYFDVLQNNELWFSDVFIFCNTVSCGIFVIFTISLLHFKEIIDLCLTLHLCHKIRTNCLEMITFYDAYRQRQTGQNSLW